MRGNYCLPTAIKYAAEFQFTPLREGQPPQVGTSPLRSAYFNSRPCVRGNLGELTGTMKQRKFQFTPLREGQLEEMTCPCADGVFQFTPLREGQRHLLSRDR